MTLWIVDQQPARNLGLTGEPLVDVIRGCGHEAIETRFDPAKQHLAPEAIPYFDSGRPLIVTGSVGFASWAHTHWPLRPGAFCSERLEARHWLPAYGVLTLNADAQWLTYGEFLMRPRTEPVFIKPAGGGKLLSGLLLEPGTNLQDAHFSRHRRWPTIPEDFLLLVASPREILGEWRFVIVGEQAIAASQYKWGETLVFERGAPQEAWAVARAIAVHTWRPTEVFVVDIAQTSEGYFVLELNTFGTAGLYACDLEDIVRAVAPYAAE
ncbi:ATP-grasp domain-containing protein [Armatimonas sp.]|uniref:ATP-grasp domain-containing protein n=1 Tax=Armatimonas sp. TaxID=1872638 RepID=UPI00286C7FD1|nr:ATP-grasp domain-containing protein [Armatimonas sp.]